MAVQRGVSCATCARLPARLAKSGNSSGGRVTSVNTSHARSGFAVRYRHDHSSTSSKMLRAVSGGSVIISTSPNVRSDRSFLGSSASLSAIQSRPSSISKSMSATRFESSAHFSFKEENQSRSGWRYSSARWSELQFDCQFHRTSPRLGTSLLLILPRKSSRSSSVNTL